MEHGCMMVWTIRRYGVTTCFWVIIFLCLLVGANPALAERASLVFNSATGAVLHAKNARLKSFPASLTKLMTLYLLFEALDSKKILLDDQVTVSAEAERQPPSRLGLKKGWQITVEEILLALIVKSANDAAVVAAEHIAGSEPDFVKIMNARAKSLGMADTFFGNASGLPDNHQTSTALDLAVLAQKLSLSFPAYYPFLLKTTFSYRRRTFERENDLINSSENAHKLKTGFTCQAGYNLVATAERDRQKLIGVILGAPNIAGRNASMAKLLNQALIRPKTGRKTLTLRSLRGASGQGSTGTLNTMAIADSCIVGKSMDPYDQITGWGLVVGVDKSELQSLNLASNTIQRFPKLLKDAKPAAIPFMRKVLLYRSYLTGLKEAAAVDACHRMRDRGYYCVAQNPETLRIRIKEGRLALKQAQAQ
jgi:D-alanyl-D-alanine carboxypeptidase